MDSSLSSKSGYLLILLFIGLSCVLMYRAFQHGKWLDFSIGLGVLIVCVAAWVANYSEFGYKCQLRLKARHGDAEAQSEYGVICMESGRAEEAVSWWRKAVAQNDIDAYTLLARAYYEGKGIKRDLDECHRLWLIAAEKGHPIAQLYLGMYLRSAECPRRDALEAARWLRASAQQAHPEAQIALAQAYELGSGVDYDPQEALRWYRIAAEQGHPEAMCQLAAYAYLGEGGVEPDKDAAIRLWKKAAEQECPTALFMLARAYMLGEATPEKAVKLGEFDKKKCSEVGEGAEAMYVEAFQLLCAAIRHPGEDSHGFTAAMQVLQTLQEQGYGAALERIRLYGPASSLSTPLDRAVIRGDGAEVRRLLESDAAGIDPEKKNSAVIKAVENQEAGILQCLLDAGGDANACDGNGCSPLQIAANSGMAEIVRCLLKAGAEVDKKDIDGYCALFYAAQQGDVDTVQALLEAGADVNAQYGANNTSALVVACSDGRLDVVKTLVEAGADVNKPSVAENTPLIIAAEQGHLPVVEYLLGAGADPSARNGDKQSAADAAAAYKHPEVADFLRAVEKK